MAELLVGVFCVVIGLIILGFVVSVICYIFGIGGNNPR